MCVCCCCCVCCFACVYLFVCVFVCVVDVCVCCFVFVSLCVFVCVCSANVPVVAEDQESWRLPTDAHTVVPYLAPVPPSGTGVHRFVFTLYTHAHPLKKTPTWSKKASEDWIHQRTFSSAQFLADNMSVGGGMRPFTFSYFQTYWDASVRHIFKHVLSELIDPSFLFFPWSDKNYIC